MAKLPWSNFKKTHGNHSCFVANASSALPKGLQFDKNGLKLPTPHGLFSEWLAKALSDDWSCIKVAGGFVVGVSSQSDLNVIVNSFPAIGSVRETVACPKTVPINYTDNDYTRLSKHIGYAV